MVGSSGLGSEPYVTLVEYVGEGYWGTTKDDELNGFDSCSVTHWMPLPPPLPEAYAPALRSWEEGRAVIRAAQLRGKAN